MDSCDVFKFMRWRMNLIYMVEVEHVPDQQRCESAPWSLEVRLHGMQGLQRVDDGRIGMLNTIRWTPLLMGDGGHRLQREEHIGVRQHTVRG